jgi:hypothetical protein
MLALALPLMLAATSPSSAHEADARCLAFFAYAAGTMTDPAAKQSATTGVLYFLGKLKAIDPNFPLEATMRRIYRDTPNFIAIDRERCTAELTAVGNELTTVGNSISAKP